jgi:excinuclease ABC subunit C
VDDLFALESFPGFGPSLLVPSDWLPTTHRVKGRRPGRLRAKVREHCPKRPGVYGMLDLRGVLIYVGKAKSLRTRLLSYFRTKSRDPKAGRILRHTRVILWEESPSEFGALLRELELIQRFRPRFNVAGQPSRKRRTYVCLGRRPAPQVFLARQPPRRVDAWYGPIPAGAQAQEAIRRLNDAFLLRDCPQEQTMHFRDQQELFPLLRAAGCLRHEIHQCLGPCAGVCSQAEYEEQARSARAFLEGRNVRLLKRLKREMREASAALEFERAAGLRDRYVALRWLHEHLTRWRRIRTLTAIYPVRGHDGIEHWYILVRGQVRGVLPAPLDAVTAQQTVTRIADILAERPGASGTPAAENPAQVLLVAAWMRRYPAEQTRLRLLGTESETTGSFHLLPTEEAPKV